MHDRKTEMQQLFETQQRNASPSPFDYKPNHDFYLPRKGLGFHRPKEERVTKPLECQVTGKQTPAAIYNPNDVSFVTSHAEIVADTGSDVDSALPQRVRHGEDTRTEGKAKVD